MKKRIILLGVLLSAISLASCGGNTNTETSTALPTSETAPSTSGTSESSTSKTAPSTSGTSESSTSETTPSQSTPTSSTVDEDEEDDEVVDLDHPVIDNEGKCHLAGVVYEKNPDNKYVAIGLEENSTVTKVVIPASIGGIDVVEIKDWAFKETKITSLDIADSVTKIGKRAFYSCRQLRNVKLSNNITKLEDRVFFGCTSLTSITIPSSVTEIESLDTFKDCHKLVEIYNLSGASIPDITLQSYVKVVHTSLNEKSIVEDSGKYRFAHFDNEYYLLGYNGKKDKIVLPDSFTFNNETINSYRVYKYAFAYSFIKEIYVSKSVTAFASSAFKYNELLEKIEVDSNNQYLDSRNNCNAIIKKETNTLVKACKNTVIPNDVLELGANSFENVVFEGTIPNSVVKINAEAFDDVSTSFLTKDGNCYYLGNSDNPYLYLYSFEGGVTSVTVNSNCKIIGSHLYKNSSVKSITIPKGIIYVASLRSLEILDLETIVYEGTVEEWNAIPKTTHLGLYGKTITCTNGNVDIPALV